MVRTQFNSLVETFIRMEILRPGSTGFPIEKSEFFTLSNLSSLEDLKWWKSNWKMGAPQRLYGMSTLSLVLAMEMISNIGIETYQRPAHRPGSRSKACCCATLAVSLYRLCERAVLEHPALHGIQASCLSTPQVMGHIIATQISSIKNAPKGAFLVNSACQLSAGTWQR